MHNPEQLKALRKTWENPNADHTHEYPVSCDVILVVELVTAPFDVNPTARCLRYSTVGGTWHVSVDLDTGHMHQVFDWLIQQLQDYGAFQN